MSTLTNGRQSLDSQQEVWLPQTHSLSFASLLSVCFHDSPAPMFGGAAPEQTASVHPSLPSPQLWPYDLDSNLKLQHCYQLYG